MRTHFGSDYVQARRALLLSSIALLFLSLPNVVFSKIPLVGIEMSGPSTSFVLVILLGAVLFNALQFFFVFQDEADHLLRENKEADNLYREAIPTALRDLSQAAEENQKHLRSLVDYKIFDDAQAQIQKSGNFWMTDAFRERFAYLAYEAIYKTSERFFGQVRKPEATREYMEHRRQQFGPGLKAELERGYDDLIREHMGEAAFDVPYRQTGQSLRTIASNVSHRIADEEGRVNNAAKVVRQLSRQLAVLRGIRKVRYSLEKWVPMGLAAIAILHLIGRLWYAAAPSLPKVLENIGLIGRL